ncbi:MAG: transcription termination factor NusA [Deltaproteobacteria bacterium]
MFPDLKRLIEQMSSDKGIEKIIVVEAIVVAIVSAAKRKLGQNVDVEANYNDETGELEVFQFKTVVEHVTDPLREITIEDACKNFDAGAQINDGLGIKLDAGELGRIAIQTAKQIIIQKVKDAERDNVFEEFKDQKLTIVSGFVVRQDMDGVVINLGKTEALLPPNEQISQEFLKRGERVKALIVDVRKSSKGPQVIVTRFANNFLKALFELEVPEIADGTVSIINVARDPGRRAKVAVTSKNKDVDPVGACVGMRGARVQNIVQELKGERVDIVAYTEDKVQYICNALAPAKVHKVIIDEDNKTMDVIVVQDQLSLAIGKGGQNVRLAAKLTGWRVDVMTEKIKGEEAPVNEEKQEVTDVNAEKLSQEQ